MNRKLTPDIFNTPSLYSEIKIKKMEDALNILQSNNFIRNDKEAYMWELIEYALGRVDDKPIPEDYGITVTEKGKGE